MKFTEFSFHPRLMEGLEATNYETATPVQEQTIPLIMQGRDIIASAQTGTGKTAAFLLPLLNRLLTESHDDGYIHALIIVPTRELALQINSHIEGLSYFTSVSAISVYGGGDGHAFVQEKKALSQGIDIVVCTPGKLISHLNMGYVRLNRLSYLVLDEADRMLDMGFYDDIMRIISKVPEKRQTLLFSATMPPKIRTMAKKILHNPSEINIAISRPPDKIVQLVYSVYEAKKIPLLVHLLKTGNAKSLLIFCSRKQTVKQLTATLKRAGINAAEIHSDLEQQQREEVLRGFSAKRIPVLVATDVLSRGIDIDSIELVINFDVPGDGEDYVHRIGRTARAETDGMAITLVSETEQRKFAAIEKLIGITVNRAELPEAFGPAPVYNPNERRHSGKGGGHRGGSGGQRSSGGQRGGSGNRSGQKPQRNFRNDKPRNDK